MTTWKVVPVCEYQKLDVRESDLLNDGDYRKCDVYRGGGGYDRFPHLAGRYMPTLKARHQFVVQLYGCPLDCGYCYVTRSGVWGRFKERTTEEILQSFLLSGQDVLHLMGGAPAIYLEQWCDLLWKMPDDKVFTSDFLLIEKDYSDFALTSICKYNALYAVDIKGVTPENFEANTRKPFTEEWRLRFNRNLERLMLHSVPFYLTFTNPDMNHYDKFVEDLTKRFGKKIMEGAFTINLVDYEATKYVDIRP